MARHSNWHSESEPPVWFWSMDGRLKIFPIPSLKGIDTLYERSILFSCGNSFRNFTKALVIPAHMLLLNNLFIVNKSFRKQNDSHVFWICCYVCAALWFGGFSSAQNRCRRQHRIVLIHRHWWLMRLMIPNHSFIPNFSYQWSHLASIAFTLDYFPYFWHPYISNESIIMR